ncbi:MAG TPA: hypothetical protein VMV69_29895 [Pirellulales bacterium]|nr:hypothetical protein [Pirellulales bacterium]
MKRVLEELPQNDAAIVREEGLALLHELNNDIARALRHRAREIQLTERLHDSVRESRQAGEYDERMGASILAGRDAKVLRQRRAILKALITKQISGRQVDAVPAESRAGHETEGFSIDDLVAAKKLVGQVGSIEKVKEALAALARLS